MELIKISRSKSFEMVNGFGLKIWDKLSAEMSIAVGEDPKLGYKAMDDLIEEVHRESYKELSLVADNTPVPVVDLDNPTKTMIEEMEACNNYADIQSFRFTVKNDEEQAVYEQKFNELSPKNK